MRRTIYATLLILILALLFSTRASTSQSINHEACRPDGLYRSPGLDVPYCLVYDTEGREMMGDGHPRRIIGYFTGWRHGKDGFPAYLVKDIPWDKLTHINYAFAHVDGSNRISIGDPANPNNPATGMEWPGVPGAEMDPLLPYKGHFNLLTRYKQQHPHVKTLISVGGWAETGGYLDESGNRVPSGGFYTMTTNADNSVNREGINTFADSVVAFLRRYNFDGVDIDYEYPTSMRDAGNPLDWHIANPRRAGLMRSYVVLMQTLRERLDAASVQDGKYYMLTVAAPSSGYLLRGMEVHQVSAYLDYVNIMSYDLHGAWNEFVGPNAALYDDGQDAELRRWNVYGTPEYKGIGYLNTDWAYHYFRGSLPPGRINIGVPFYTRGWRHVTGGTNGLWGQAGPISNCATGLSSCGDGAVGIDNLWHDIEEGREIPAGSNPLWHARNLEREILPSYLAIYGLDPTGNPEHRLEGSYDRHYDATLVAPWLWNSQKRVFLSLEDEQSIGIKSQYVIDKGIGGIMFWELAGDYAWYPERNGGQGEYFMGSTLVSLLAERFATAPPYGNQRATRPMPSQLLDVSVSLEEFPLGDNNFPISPKLKITNHSNVTIPGGAEFQFDYGTSAPDNARDQSGFNLSVIESGHTGNNIGGLKGPYHRARFLLPSWQSIPPGATIQLDLVYYLPISMPSNWIIRFGEQSYGLVQEQRRQAGVTPPTPSPTGSATAPEPTRTPTPTGTPVSGCTAPVWEPSQVYYGGDEVAHQGRQWRAKWWTQGEEPGTTGEWGVWEDRGPCGDTPPPSPTPIQGATQTPTPTASSGNPITPTPSATPTPGVPPWEPGRYYTTGTLVSYEGKQYSCRQSHTSQSGWEPPHTPALWLEQ